MTERERLLYSIVASLAEETPNLVFKGALVTKLLLKEKGFENFERETNDIDARWIDQPPSMDELAQIVQNAVEKIDGHLQAVPCRQYGNGVSAGLKVINTATGDTIVSIDVEMKQVSKSSEYWIGDTVFKGNTADQVLCDKLAVISCDKIFRRSKDLLDIYALSQCCTFSVEDICRTAEENGRVFGDYQAFLSRTDELRHAYDKLRGVTGKPDFEVIYQGVKKMIEPFALKVPNVKWNCEEQEWSYYKPVLERSL